MSEMSAIPKDLNLEASPRQGMSHYRTVSREPMGSVAAPKIWVIAGLCISWPLATMLTGQNRGEEVKLGHARPGAKGYGRLDECVSQATQNPLLQSHGRVWLPRGAGLLLPTAKEEALTSDSLGASPI